MGRVEQRPVLWGVNPQMKEFDVLKGHPFVQVDLQRGRAEPVGHLYIPSNKVPTDVLAQIQAGQVEALALNDPEGPWEIVDVQLRPGSNNK